MLTIDDIRDQIVLVTGASSGISAATARVLATCGAKVALNYNSGRQAAEQLATEITNDGGSAITVGGDILNRVGAETVVKLAVEKLGGLDCLINNAGAVERTPATIADNDLVDRMIDVNMRSILWTVSAATGLGRRMVATTAYCPGNKSYSAEFAEAPTGEGTDIQIAEMAKRHK